METTVKSTLSGKLVKGLRMAADEIEEFSLKARLGKMEAHDLFEDLKKRYRQVLHEAVTRLMKVRNLSEDKATRLRALLEELRVQLALGKAETKELFEEQYRNIRRAVARVQAQFRRIEVPRKLYQQVDTELQKLKIKLEILKLRYKVKKAVSREELKERKNDLRSRLEALKESLSRKKKKGKWENFNTEISEAWTHLKKAFV